MRIISIDPGYDRLGIAVLEKVPGQQKETLLYSDCFETDPKSSFALRLTQLGKEAERVIEEYQPAACALESLFFNKNQTTAMKVAEARGVVLYQAASRGLSIYEFTPLEIKIAVTGYGRSGKDQVTAMVKHLISVKKPIKHDDEYDAIAVGLTCFASLKTLNMRGKR